MTTDLKATVFLPHTDFAMKAGLAEREPALLKRWDDIDLYGRLRAAANGRPRFVLHDGPPYANGNIHIGHALNKILKDIINRTRQMSGMDAVYVPGWDCHGLPIEWQVESRYRAAGNEKDAVPLIRFRKECREFAGHWIDVQREEFIRLGVLGDWARPYKTMDFAAEAQIAREIGKFVLNGGLYRGVRPVMWSVVEKTALAEAEVEYHDHKSTAIHVRFPLIKASDAALEGASVVIWTTTPWTLPGNRAVAYGEAIDYVLVEVEAVTEKSRARVGERLLVAHALLETTQKAAGIGALRTLATLPGDALADGVCAHPLRGQGYDFDVPLLPGAHVTTEQGSGFVHTAPGHGVEDFEVGQAFGLEVPETVDGDGTFAAHVPLFAGVHVFKADAPVCAALDDAGALLARATVVHSYPHSWRSKAPLIFRTTPQWFISMETNDLRTVALDAIDRVRWVPAAGRERIRAMIETRPDWVVSRQRAWGVPLALFVERTSGAPLRDARVLERIADAFAHEGSDAWFESDPARFLAPEYDPAQYERIDDILDVWFESGASHSFVLEGVADLKWPASLYLEGSDQHRGWFHSSLLESCGTRGAPPYEAVLTHGFVLDEDGRKMSKSAGNVVAPQSVVERYGADILRLWVVNTDYSEDVRIGPDILKHQAETYRRYRNTLRYLLGNLAGFTPAERIDPAAMPELERWVLHRLHELDARRVQAVADFEFHGFYQELHTFCAVDLSAIYFDVRKDALYCDRADSPRRRAARTVLDILFDTLSAYLAPVLCFTAEEAWLARHPEETGSVHLRTFAPAHSRWRDDALARKWSRVRAVRRVVTGALEVERREKRLGSSLQAHPQVFLAAADAQALAGVDLAELCITSGITLTPGAVPAGAFTLDDVPGVGVLSAPAPGHKCARCWRVLDEVAAADESVCGRCADAVSAFARAD